LLEKFVLRSNTVVMGARYAKSIHVSYVTSHG
jgi:hypothetical protein